MTIAACHLSHEGVVLGADSTTTMFVQGPTPQSVGVEQHFNFAQKIFQVGESGTLAMTMWGLGSLRQTSFRTLIAEFADAIQANPPASVRQAAEAWAEQLWSAYQDAWDATLRRVRELLRKPTRAPEEERELGLAIQNYSGGFCLAGRCPTSRRPAAYEIQYQPDLAERPDPIPIEPGTTRFWGCPSSIDRLIYGVDFAMLGDILGSGHWTGSRADLLQIVRRHSLGQPRDLPIREAVDWVHASIYATIKTMKFSHMAPVCGGPIEVAVITTDRPFRWVIHKNLDAAVSHDGFTHE